MQTQHFEGTACVTYGYSYKVELTEDVKTDPEVVQALLEEYVESHNQPPTRDNWKAYVRELQQQGRLKLAAIANAMIVRCEVVHQDNFLDEFSDVSE